jgi:hypothetical protein
MLRRGTADWGGWLVLLLLLLPHAGSEL